jgi:surfeit locus 1 family protein
VKRFPIGLTLVTLIAFVLLTGLGVWQLQRLAWKQALLTRIAALQNAAPHPIGPLLDRLSHRGDVAFSRVSTDCAAPTSPAPMMFRYALRDGRIAWRLMTICPLVGAPYDGILLDRGLVTRFTGAMAPSPAEFPHPAGVVGVLREPGAKPLFDTAAPVRQGDVTVLRLIDRDTLSAVAAQAGFAHLAPMMLAVEGERPALEGLVPAALPEDIPNNHFVYAVTWFTLAGILAWFYVAMVWRRLKGQ